jgi:hypothetical protein
MSARDFLPADRSAAVDQQRWFDIPIQTVTDAVRWRCRGRARKASAAPFVVLWVLAALCAPQLPSAVASPSPVAGGCKSVTADGYCVAAACAEPLTADNTCRICVFEVGKFTHKTKAEYEFAGNAEDMANQGTMVEPYLFLCPGMRRDAIFAVKGEGLRACIKGRTGGIASVGYGKILLTVHSQVPKAFTLPIDKSIGGGCAPVPAFQYPNAGTVSNSGTAVDDDGVTVEQEEFDGTMTRVARFGISLTRCVHSRGGVETGVNCSLEGGKITIFTQK